MKIENSVYFWFDGFSIDRDLTGYGFDTIEI